MTITIVAVPEDLLAKKTARWLSINAFEFERVDPRVDTLPCVELQVDQRIIRIALGETRALDYAIEELGKAEIQAKRDGRKLAPIVNRVQKAD